MEYKFEYNSPLGILTLVSDGINLTGLLYGRTPEYAENPLPIFESTSSWLNLYFDGREPGFTPKLKPLGTPFQAEVWAELLKIPYGKTVSYGNIARILAARRGIPRMSAQAIGNAVGKNPIAIIIPCHRVIGSDGSLTGYSGGMGKKLALLRIEGHNSDLASI